MAISKPTRWPLFELHLKIWKLSISTSLMSDNIQFNYYQYLRLEIHWGYKKIVGFNLYDTYERIDLRG